MGTIAVIPARYRSKRLPGKPLLDLLGKPMLQRVYERVAEARLIDEVIIATDDERIRSAGAAFGARVLMTSSEHESGTDRIAEVVARLGLEDAPTLVVNVQGDEPVIAPEAIDEAVTASGGSAMGMATLKREITSRERLFDENVVKVTTDAEGFALYFSRAPIPWPPGGGATAADAVLDPDELPPATYYEHVGLYVYPAAVLARLAATPPVTLERIERLEQLRALVHGIRIRVAETRHGSIAVDTEADLEKVRGYLSRTKPGTTESKSKSNLITKVTMTRSSS